MKKYLAMVALVAVLPACKKPLASIRDPNVYANEIDYNNMVQKQAVAHLKMWMSEHCFCREGQGWIGDNAVVCEKSAKHILVVEARQEAHTHMMEYLGSLREDRPPEAPPEVPEPETLCVYE